MPDEAIVGGLLRIIGSATLAVAEFLAEYIFYSVGRTSIYLLTFGRVDTDQTAKEGVDWVTGVIGFLTVGGLCWGGWKILS